MPEYVVHYKSKAGDQYVRLQARDRNEAEVLAGLHQQRRAARYDLTMQNLESGAGNFANMTPKQRAAELERRKLDFSRYDVVSGDEVGAADAPLKIESIKEAK